MSRHTRKHRFQPVLALDANYMPMVEIIRRKALKAVAAGRAHVLNLRTWSPVHLREAVGQPIHVVVFPKAKAVPEAKLGFGRGTHSILRRDNYRCQYFGCDRRGTTVDRDPSLSGWRFDLREPRGLLPSLQCEEGREDS
jgi:hypothetical protein